MTDLELDPTATPWLHLVSAFLAMEPSDSLISLAKVCGGGSVTEKVQRFIWSNCISKSVGKGYVPYLRNFLKKLIVEVESSHGDVLDEIYEQYAGIMTSLKDSHLVERKWRICKTMTFLFPEGSFDLPSCPKSGKLMVPLQCSLNMLEGDTGCAIWPSSLYLSEFIISFPEIFSNRSCFEVGAGVGLVGICLAHVKASKVALTDGDPSTLANMRSNLELNQLGTGPNLSERFIEDPDVVQCIHLPWESASETDVRVFMPEIVLGADVIYDPSCLPHLVRLLAILLNEKKSYSQPQKENSKTSMPDSKCIDEVNGTNQREGLLAHDLDGPNSNGGNGHGVDTCNRASNDGRRERPVAYIASVIRNIDTFSCFLALAEQANLTITDITETRRPFNLLPYMQSYNRSSIRLFTVSCKT